MTGGIAYGAVELHSVLNDSSVKDALSQLNIPKWFPVVLLGLAVITYCAHGHEADA